MKNSVLIPAASAVDALAKTPGFPVLVAFKIAKLNVALKHASKPFDEARQQLVGEYTDPTTGQFKMTDTAAGPSPMPAQMDFNKAIADLMELEVDVSITEDQKLSWNDITANGSFVAPSRIENLYRNGFLTDKPDFTNFPKKTLTGLTLERYVNLSTALFYLGNSAMPLSSPLVPVIIENLTRLVPPTEAALRSEAKDEDQTLEVLALDFTQLEKLNPVPTGELLTELMDLM